MNSSILTRLAAGALVAAIAPVAVAPAAHAGDDEKIRRGSCTGATDWKIKAKTDDNRIEVEAEIDSNVNGQQWRWVLRHNGSVSARGTSQTQPPSGSFEVERKTVDAPGVDTYRFRARHAGEVCVARIRY